MGRGRQIRPVAAHRHATCIPAGRPPPTARRLAYPISSLRSCSVDTEDSDPIWKLARRRPAPGVTGVSGDGMSNVLPTLTVLMIPFGLPPLVFFGLSALDGRATTRPLESIIPSDTYRGCMLRPRPAERERERERRHS